MRGAHVLSCVHHSRMRLPVPPPLPNSLAADRATRTAVLLGPWITTSKLHAIHCVACPHAAPR
jgi:hypothetical protein